MEVKGSSEVCKFFLVIGNRDRRGDLVTILCNQSHNFCALRSTLLE